MSDSFLAVEVEKNNTVLVTVPENLVVSTPDTEVVVTSGGYQGIQGPPGPQGVQGVQGPVGPTGPTATISTASDVDVSTLTSGSLLIYNQNTGKWVSNTLLAAQVVDAGEF